MKGARFQTSRLEPSIKMWTNAVVGLVVEVYSAALPANVPGEDLAARRSRQFAKTLKKDELCLGSFSVRCAKMRIAQHNIR